MANFICSTRSLARFRWSLALPHNNYHTTITMGKVTRASGRKASSLKEKETPVAAAKTKAKKKTSTATKAPARATAAGATAAAMGTTTTSTVVVTIEACKQWSAFKTRANKIVAAVGDKATVLVNPEPPGRGNFVVRIKDDDNNREPIIELLAMKRPFAPLKALDMDQVSEKVLNAIEEA
jgi:hypothetical protein